MYVIAQLLEDPGHELHSTRNLSGSIVDQWALSSYGDSNQEKKSNNTTADCFYY
jgi:hypothetical protein